MKDCLDDLSGLDKEAMQLHKDSTSPVRDWVDLSQGKKSRWRRMAWENRMKKEELKNIMDMIKELTEKE